MATPQVSKAFATFLREAPSQGQAWMATIRTLAENTALDPKTSQLAYLAVLAALRMESGVPYHTLMAKQAGATRQEVISAILVGLPAAGHSVVSVLPTALEAYDAA